MNSISHYDMTSKSCFPGIASVPPETGNSTRLAGLTFPQTWTVWGLRWSATNSTWKWMAMHGHVILQYQQQTTDAKSIRPYQTAGDVGSIIAHRSSVTFVNRQVLSARALHPKKTRTRREKHIIDCFVPQPN